MKKTRIIVTILTVTMAFSVTACLSNSVKSEEETATVTTETAETAGDSEVAKDVAEEDTEGLMKVNASDIDADDGTIDPALVGTWEFSHGEGADKITIYYTYNDDGTGSIVWFDAQSGELPPQEFKYTTKNGDTLIMNNSETHSEAEKYTIEGDTLTTDDGLQVTTYTKSK